MPQLLPWLLPLLQEYILTLSNVVLKENRHPGLQARLRASSTVIGLGTSQCVRVFNTLPYLCPNQASLFTVRVVRYLSTA